MNTSCIGRTKNVHHRPIQHGNSNYIIIVIRKYYCTYCIGNNYSCNINSYSNTSTVVIVIVIEIAYLVVYCSTVYTVYSLLLSEVYRVKRKGFASITFEAIF